MKFHDLHAAVAGALATTIRQLIMKKPKGTTEKKRLAEALRQLADQGITRGEQGLYLNRNGKQIHLCGKFKVKGTAQNVDGTATGILCCSFTDENEAVVMPFDALRDMNKLAVMLPLLGVLAPLEGYAMKAIAKYIHVVSQLKTCFVLKNEGVEWINHGDAKQAVAVCGSRLIAPADISAEVALKNSIYAEHGTLSEWRKGAKPILNGNPIPIAVVSAALSAPLKQLFDLPLLSLLLAGPSASGKTTLGRFVNSLYGPAREPHGWSGTVNALEALAISHTDAPLMLDEMEEGDATDVLDAIYRLNNGVQKARANSNGTLQDIAAIRTVVISTSEITLSEHAKSGRKVRRDGHEARMPTLVLDEKYGCFSALNGFASAAEIPAAINQLGRACHGVVWPVYMRGLITQRAKCVQFIEDHRDEYSKEIATIGHHNTLSPLERRVLAGITSWALAGEMAIRLGILPLKRKAVVAALQHVYAKWLARWREGEGIPRTVILDHIRDFFQRHAATMFISLCDWQQHGRRELAGYETFTKKHGGLYLVHRGFFEHVLCKDFGLDQALVALDAAGFLVAHAGGRSWLQRMPGEHAKNNNERMRFYAIKHLIRFDV